VARWPLRSARFRGAGRPPLLGFGTCSGGLSPRSVRRSATAKPRSRLLHRSPGPDRQKIAKGAIICLVNEAVAYWLLFLDLAVGAAVIWLAIWCALWLIRRVRLPPRQANAAQGAGRPPASVKRRCEECGYGWWATPGTERSISGMRLRRWIRRSRRRHRRAPAAWSAPQGWSRCPSCLSTEVRDSRNQDGARGSTSGGFPSFQRSTSTSCSETSQSGVETVADGASSDSV
jgi:hypothetical protein